MRVVIDTNILIDGSSDDYNFGNQLIEGRKIADEDYHGKLEQYFDKVQLVAHGERLDVVEDKEDNKLVESAVGARADYLITSDKHLLKLGQYNQTKIVPPSSFWQEFEEEIGEGWGKWVDNFMR